MNDRRADDDTDRDPRQRDDRDGRGRPNGGSDANTRFLQLEMSRVLYAEAEEVAKPALRELLLEAAKEHLRARFGDRIARLARLAVDELVSDIEASLDVEEQIRRRRDSGDPDDRVREALARTRSEPGAASAERKQSRPPASRRRR